MFHAKRNILNQMMIWSLLVGVGFATLFYGASPTMAADAPNLGTAGAFGVLADTYTNTVAGTTINGNLGYTTGPAVTPTVSGSTHVADAAYNQAGLNQAAALADLNSQNCMSLGTGAVDLDTIDIGSGPGVFTPGCYSSGGAMNITVNQTVTLKGPGVYIFRPGGALTTGADSRISFDGLVCENDVFWAPAGATTIGANAHFAGNILDPAGITLGENATLTGRALAFGATVTTDKNLISVPICTTMFPAKLGLLKTIDNTGGGTATTGQFTLTATGDATTGPTIITGASPVTAIDAPVGFYTITETGPDGYVASFSVSGGGALVGNMLTITAADAGKNITVSITNTYVSAIGAKLGLLKTIDNTGGGTATAEQFTLIATGDASTGPTIVTGTTPVTAVNVPVGVYTITETGPDGYIGTFSVSGGGALAGNMLTITEADAGKTITVTIANNFIPAGATKLGLRKTLNGGTATADQFTMTATGDASTGPTIVTGTTPVAAVNVPVGVYTITETGPVGYTTGFTVSGGGTLAGNKLTITEADAGKTIIITVANTFSPIPTLSEWGLIILMMLAGLTFMYSLKKREE